MEMSDLMRSLVNYIGLVDRKADLIGLIADERRKQAQTSMFQEFNRLEGLEHELREVDRKIEEVRSHMKAEHYDPAVTV